MKIAYIYSHLGGAEILQIHHKDVLEDIKQVIENVSAKKTKVSKEKSNTGKLLYSPIDMNIHFKNEFEKHGYHEIRDTFTVKSCTTGKEISAYKQVDFVKDTIFIEVQFGKYAFMFYDLAKFQYFFNESKAEVGIEIVPCYDLHKNMSTGVSYGEQLIHDIERLKKHFPAVPIMVILIDADDQN